jgi:hypothetical protein
LTGSVLSKFPSNLIYIEKAYRTGLCLKKNKSSMQGTGMTMTTEYAEKRSYRRVSVECDIYYKMLDSAEEEEEVGRVANLSGRGLMFIAERGVPLNVELEIRISPGNQLTPPLRARVKVVRMEKQKRGGGYEIGAVIQQTYE